MPANYTDQALQAEIDAYTGGLGVGPRNVARVLLTVPEDVRRDVYWEAQTMQNFVGGRISQNVQAAAAQWKRTGTFPYRAEAAQFRKDEADLNAAVRAVDPTADRIFLTPANPA